MIFKFNNTKAKTILRDLSKTMAALTTSITITLRKRLPELYIIGSTNKSDYGPLVYAEELPKKVPQASGEYLDRLGYMFGVVRRLSEKDEAFRQRILFVVKISATNEGMENTIKFIFTNSGFFPRWKDGTPLQFNVRINESIANYFDGNTSLSVPVRTNFLYGITVYISPVSHHGFSKSIDYSKILEGESFRELISTISAAGTVVDRVIFEQAGAGGNRGEVYDYKV